MPSSGSFDFAAFQAAFESTDVPKWLAFYDPHAIWLEYRHGNPPARPNRMQGREQIEAFLRTVAAAGLELHLSHEVVSPRRIAFRVTCHLPDGRTVLEHVMLEVRDGLITEQVDIEAWD